MKNLKMYFLIFALVFSLVYLPSCKKAATETPDPTANFTVDIQLVASYILALGVPVGVNYNYIVTLNETAGVGATITNVFVKFIDNYANTVSGSISVSSFFGTNQILPNQSLQSIEQIQYIGKLNLAEATTFEVTFNFVDTYGHNITKVFSTGIAW